MSEQTEQTFEEALARLEQIVRQMEQGDVALETSLALFEEGVRLSRHCAHKLDEAEKRIAVLTAGEDGSITAADLETGEEIQREEPPAPGDDDIPF
jgi:exodeoxyribonuclease VII small subunit